MITRNAVIVQDGCSCWIRSYLSKISMRQKEHSCLHEVHGSIRKTWEYIQMYTDNSKEYVTAYHELSKDARHENSSSLRNQWHRRESCPTSKRRNGSGDGQSGLPEEWWDWAMEWYCYLRNVHDKMADGKTADARTYGVTLDGPVVPFGAQSVANPSLSKVSHGFISLVKNAEWNVNGSCLACAGEGQVTPLQQIAETWNTCLPPMFKSKGSSIKKLHMEKLLQPCGVGTLNIFDLFRPHQWRKTPSGETSCKTNGKRGRNKLRRGKRKYFRNMSGDFIHCDHELHRATFVRPKRRNIPIETRRDATKDRHNASEHALGDNWGECQTRHYFDKALDRVWLSQQADGAFEKEWYESVLPSASFILAEAAWRVCICNERGLAHTGWIFEGRREPRRRHPHVCCSVEEGQCRECVCQYPQICERLVQVHR